MYGCVRQVHIPTLLSTWCFCLLGIFLSLDEILSKHLHGKTANVVQWLKYCIRTGGQFHPLAMQTNWMTMDQLTFSKIARELLVETLEEYYV